MRPNLDNAMRVGAGFPFERLAACPECNGAITYSGEQFCRRGIPYCSGRCMTNSFLRQRNNRINPRDIDLQLIDC